MRRGRSAGPRRPEIVCWTGRGLPADSLNCYLLAPPTGARYLLERVRCARAEAAEMAAKRMAHAGPGGLAALSGSS